MKGKDSLTVHEFEYFSSRSEGAPHVNLGESLFGKREPKGKGGSRVDVVNKILIIGRASFN